ncbi:MAG: T9SS type A sorting domain-containing protein [Lewinellaceae bacterium]|nr:T9SS type A sorting domain-containing protein [Lewinellaceae bacterium]MCB9288757.1 T9SS type A sorting domain-containing protein [Lewinellaceae bacterium]
MKKGLILLLMAVSQLSFGQYRCATENPEGSTHRPSAPAGMTVEGRSVITIPLVVHIVWHTQEENLSEAQVQSQADVLNADFRALNTEIPSVPAVFAAAVADMEIEFCLVATTRTQTPYAGIANLYANGQRRVCHTALGGRDAIDPAHYLNVWVSARNDGACGDGTFPENPQAPAGEQGVFIRPDCFGTAGTAAPPFNLGRTTTHEIGHYLNLKHLWGEGLEDPLCQSDDMVEDTEEQAYSYSDYTGQDCPTHPSFSCGSADMFMNFMNLPADRCMAMFTHGQKERAWDAIATFRPGLLESSCMPVGLQEAAPGDTPPLLAQNPASGEIALLLAEKEEYEIAIFDAAGRLVFSEPNASGTIYRISPDMFINGIYYIKIRNGRKIHTKKLIIAR